MSKPKNMTPEQEAAWREKNREAWRNWNKNNPEKRRERDRKYRESNPEKYRELNHKNFQNRYKENPEKYREWMRKRRKANRQQSAADSFFQLQAAAQQISIALETKTKTNQ